MERVNWHSPSPEQLWLFNRRVLGRKPRRLSKQSIRQVQAARKKFLHFVYRTNFDFMPKTTKLRVKIFDHMSQDARITIARYLESMRATSNFEAHRRSGSQRIFQGFCTITKSTKKYILKHKAEELREVFVIGELALRFHFYFLGVSRCDAAGWILDDVQSDELQAITDVAQYLTQKAKVWKVPKHCTSYRQFQGQKPNELRLMLRQKIQTQAEGTKLASFPNSNNRKSRKRRTKKLIRSGKEWNRNDSIDHEHDQALKDFLNE